VETDQKAFTLIIAAQIVALRERVSLKGGWRFTKDDAAEAGTNRNYSALRPWILPTGPD